MSHPMEGRSPESVPVFEYEVGIKVTKQSFRCVITDHGRPVFYNVLFTYEGILRWADEVCKKDAVAHGSPHYEITMKVVSV